jgi:hypothetical protein
MSNRISLDREEVDRLILLGMDLDRYQTQVIPDLQQRVGDLVGALTDLVGAVLAARQNPALASHVDESIRRAQKVLARTLGPNGRDASRDAEAVR